tara:strand:- start:647 stop:934 length:288 start_codon:yes stop_codon:yes gene_type:complete
MFPYLREAWIAFFVLLFFEWLWWETPVGNFINLITTLMAGFLIYWVPQIWLVGQIHEVRRDKPDTTKNKIFKALAFLYLPFCLALFTFFLMYILN